MVQFRNLLHPPECRGHSTSSVRTGMPLTQRKTSAAIGSSRRSGQSDAAQETSRAAGVQSPMTQAVKVSRCFDAEDTLRVARSRACGIGARSVGTRAVAEAGTWAKPLRLPDESETGCIIRISPIVARLALDRTLPCQQSRHEDGGLAAHWTAWTTWTSQTGINSDTGKER